MAFIRQGPLSSLQGIFLFPAWRMVGKDEVRRELDPRYRRPGSPLTTCTVTSHHIVRGGPRIEGVEGG